MTWTPDPRAFMRDLEAKPEALRALAGSLEDGSAWASAPIGPRRVIFIGMGSSRFAALAAAPRLRALGHNAVAEYASAEAASPGGAGTLAVAISAGGATEETLEAARRHAGQGSLVLALTNDPGSAIARASSSFVDLAAGAESGGVACRSFQHTLALLLALEDRLVGRPPSVTAARVRAAAAATEDLLERRDAWLPGAVDLLVSTGRAFLLAPVERRSSAEQGALMLREGPRLHADACETGDWLHVDVYLTKPLDYRVLLFAGSRFDAGVLDWTRQRGSTVLAVGGDVPGAAASIRYRGDHAADTALLAEILVAELVAAQAWLASENPA